MALVKQHWMNHVTWAGVVVIACMTGCANDDDGGGGGGASDVTEQEPNDERVGATKLPAGGGAFVIHGTCEDSTDNDYYDATPMIAGAYTVKLDWAAGDYQLMFDPEDGFSGDQVRSTTPPLMASGQVIAGAIQLNIDCYNANNPPGLAGVAYTLNLTLPE